MMQKSILPSSLEFEDYSWLSRNIISVTMTSEQGVNILSALVEHQRRKKQIMVRHRLHWRFFQFTILTT